MTVMRHSLVNGNFLGFLCLDCSYDEEAISIVKHPGHRFEPQSSSEKMHLWKFMRHCNPDIRKAQEKCLSRYSVLAADIKHALREGTDYPYLQLSQLAPPKLFSDMIESILGAIFIDSGGDLDACKIFLGRIGLLAYLERLFAGQVKLAHPRTILVDLFIAKWGKHPTLDTRKANSQQHAENALWGCSVKLDDVEITEVMGYPGKDDAIAAAALKAIDIINAGFDPLRPATSAESIPPDTDNMEAKMQFSG
jgi:dsRNA-specific ribonuclease